MKPILCSPLTLKPNPWNTNEVSAENMEKLKKSIQDLGFVTAVICRELDDGSLEILGGQHRAEAAIALGLPKIPVVNLGHKPDEEAKKIGLVDNSRYGTDDVLALAELLDDIGLARDELASFLPMDDDEMDQVYGAVNVDLDSLDFMETGEDDDEEVETRPEKPAQTHTNMRFRVRKADAEAIGRVIEACIREEKIDDGDESSNAGSALAILLLRKDNQA